MRLLLFLAWLFAEFWSIHLASQYIGGLAVFGLLILVAIIGSRLMQSQGFRTVANIQQAMQNNQLPAAAMLDALIVFIAGLLLVLPGFFLRCHRPGAHLQRHPPPPGPPRRSLHGQAIP